MRLPPCAISLASPRLRRRLIFRIAPACRDLQRLAVQTSAEVELLGPLTLAHYGIGKEGELTLSEHAPCDGPPAPERGATEQELRKLEAMRENLERRWVQLAASGRKLDEQKQVCAQLNGLPGGKKLKKKLKLNVGGRIFKDVLRETLCYVEGSHLAELFSGRWEGKLLRDSSGKIFLDVNPDCFGKIISFLAERKANPTAPIVAPTVPEELVPTLHRLLDFFGLGQLFAPEEEGVPPEQAGGEPEPEPDTEGDEAQAAVEDEQELIVAENEQVELPARTIDHVTQCRYGVLDQEMKRIDVTDLVADAVDDDGGLSMRVTSSDLGDPAPGEAKQLSIRYQLASWETESFEDALVRLRAVAEKECAALRREIKKHRLRVRRFEREEKWVSWCLKAEGRQPAPEVVELDVGIGAASDRVCVKRSTLRQCEDSVLARQFDAEVWAQEHAGGSSDSDDSDDSDAGVGKIAQDPLIFRKLVDQLRLIAIARADDPPPGPVLRSHEEEDFAKLLDYYFKGVEGFVKTDGEHRLAGTTVGKRIGGGAGTAVRFFLWGAAGGGNQGNSMSGATGGFSCGTVQVPRGATVTLLAGRGGHKGGCNAAVPQPAAEAGQGGNGPGKYGGGGGGGSFVVVDAELYLRREVAAAAASTTIQRVLAARAAASVDAEAAHKVVPTSAPRRAARRRGRASRFKGKGLRATRSASAWTAAAGLSAAPVGWVTPAGPVVVPAAAAATLVARGAMIIAPPTAAAVVVPHSSTPTSWTAPWSAVRTHCRAAQRSPRMLTTSTTRRPLASASSLTKASTAASSRSTWGPARCSASPRSAAWRQR